MNYKDYYKILGVEKTAAEKDVKSAYRKLARKWHPDANPDNPKAAEEKFKDIQEAYEVLGDPEKRKKYDVLGMDWQRAAQQAEQQRSYRSQYGDDGNASELFPAHSEVEDRLAAIARFYGNLIGVKYGEPFIVKEAMQLDDIVNVPVRSI